ncbi:MAG: hypothetical protein HYZ26_11925 [Chloroflexi bacterium]|nr:hypothetical protein [Chloroflexota bacterium]
MKRAILPILILTSLWLAACASGSGEADGAAAAIQNYIQAIVAQDETAAAALSCAAWEAEALTEVHAFDGVTARLEDFSCVEGPTEDGTIVNCTGAIIATYQGEDRPLDLAARAYLAVQEGGEWRMCGYK